MFVLLMFQCLLSYRKHFKMQQKECETFLENTRVKCKKKKKPSSHIVGAIFFLSFCANTSYLVEILCKDEQ